MAQTFTTAAMGAAANDSSGNKLRTGGLKIAADLTELYADVAALAGSLSAGDLMRTKLQEACDGTAGQVIAFSSQFVAADYAIQIIDYDGVGIEVTAHDIDGFTITSLSAGNFGYIVLIEV